MMTDYDELIETLRAENNRLARGWDEAETAVGRLKETVRDVRAGRDQQAQITRELRAENKQLAVNILDADRAREHTERKLALQGDRLEEREQLIETLRAETRAWRWFRSRLIDAAGLASDTSDEELIERIEAMRNSSEGACEALAGPATLQAKNKRLKDEVGRLSEERNALVDASLTGGDYTKDHACGTAVDDPDAYKVALANIREMHRVLQVREQRLLVANEELDRIRAERGDVTDDAETVQSAPENESPPFKPGDWVRSKDGAVSSVGRVSFCGTYWSAVEWSETQGVPYRVQTRSLEPWQPRKGDCVVTDAGDVREVAFVDGDSSAFGPVYGGYTFIDNQLLRPAPEHEQSSVEIPSLPDMDEIKRAAKHENMAERVQWLRELFYRYQGEVIEANARKGSEWRMRGRVASDG